MAQNVYQMVTDRIIEQMGKGEIPWRKPWSWTSMDAYGCAISYTSRRPYSLLNQFLLGKPGEWLTFKQVKELGGSVKKGAKSRFVVWYSQIQITETNKDGEEEIKKIPVLKYYNVFHIDDCEGIKSKIATVEKPEIKAPEADEASEKAILAYLEREVTLKFQNDKPSAEAYYSPSKDMVVVPMISQYKDNAEYYSTTFHELVHSTMKKSRCNRMDGNKASFFGDENYSREELVAEIGSAMLCNRMGVDTAKAFKNSVAYLQGWIKALQNDPKAIVWAAARAEKAARYILGENEAVQTA